MSPWRMAMATAAVRDSTWSFARIPATCLEAVAREMNSASAISLSVLPEPSSAARRAAGS